jgi:hypothetical protein
MASVSAQATSRLALFGCAWGSHGWKGAIGESVGTAPARTCASCAPPHHRHSCAVAPNEAAPTLARSRARPRHRSAANILRRPSPQPAAHTSFQAAISRLLCSARLLCLCLRFLAKCRISTMQLSTAARECDKAVEVSQKIRHPKS